MYQQSVCTGEENRGYDGEHYVQVSIAEGVTMGSIGRRGVFRVSQQAICAAEEFRGHESWNLGRSTEEFWAVSTRATWKV